MTRDVLRTRRLIEPVVEGTLESLRDQGRLDRRGFMRLLGLGLAAPLIAACDAVGSPGTLKLLNAVGAQNEKLERWLLSHAGQDHLGAGVKVAGEDFPSYFISPNVPVWNVDMGGPWALVVDGAVRTPLQLSLAQLQKLATKTQRVNHYCVEGWNAAVEFQGVPFTTIARMAQPVGAAGFVNFSSFDNGYHESWDMESTMHPQTMIVIAKDGKMLSPRYGAPARVHSPVKLGYKNTKYLTRITYMASANGGYWTDKGYDWFGGT